MRDEKSYTDGVQEMGETEGVRKEQGAENVLDLQNDGMNMTEADAEEFARIIREEARNLRVPEKLQPENIRKELEASEKILKLKKRRRWMKLAASAAVVVLLAGGGRAAWNVHMNRNPAQGTGVAGPEYKKDTDGETKSVEDATEGNPSGVEVDCLVYAGSYDAVEDAVKEIRERQERNYKDRYMTKGEGMDIAEQAEESTDAAMEDNAAIKAADTEKDGDYSETNLQVQGVDEADVVKTDGEYIYRLREQAGDDNNKQVLEILKADGKRIQKAGEYTFDDTENVSEFYIHDMMLIAICHGYTTEGEYTNPDEDIVDEPVPVYEEEVESYARSYTRNYTRVVFIDIRDKKNPTEKNTLTQSGGCVQSRVSDGYLYVVTGEPAGRYTGGDKDDISIPCLEGKKVSADSIYIPDGTDAAQFTTLASVDLSDTSQYQDSRTIMVRSNNFYMSTENIYLYNMKYTEPGKRDAEYTDHTEITKFHYAKGKFSGKATAQIDGVIKDTFAIDEYDGMLRVLTSVSHIKRTTIFDDIKEAVIGYRDDSSWDDNMVYVLDDGLKVLGSIAGIAKDERIYSARFQGEIGYFVTYRETDPLFSVDFSNPAKPKVIGELKIPGFSEYLHFYSDGLLLGIGQEDNEEGDSWLKLSMFDISDPKNVKEVDKYRIKDIYYSEALYNYKAVFVEPEKNIIGFGGETYRNKNGDEEWGYEEWGYGYNIYSYSKGKGFERKIAHKADLTDGHDDYDYYDIEDIRGLYIGDYIYMVSRYSEDITVYSMKNWKKAGEYTGETK